MPDKKTFNKVLIIDDDETCVFLTTITLKDMAIAGEITTAYDGKEGFAKINQTCDSACACDGECLILLDINMPIMNGFEVIDRLKQIGRGRLVEKNIIVLTSSSNPRDKDKMLGYKVKGYIEKPITEEKLLPLLQVMKGIEHE
jgi:CheY-like chemotaxis protein